MPNLELLTYLLTKIKAFVYILLWHEWQERSPLVFHITSHKGEIDDSRHFLAIKTINRIWL